MDKTLVIDNRHKYCGNVGGSHRDDCIHYYEVEDYVDRDLGLHFPFAGLCRISGAVIRGFQFGKNEKIMEDRVKKLEKIRLELVEEEVLPIAEHEYREFIDHYDALVAELGVEPEPIIIEKVGFWKRLWKKLCFWRKND